MLGAATERSGQQQLGGGRRPAVRARLAKPARRRHLDHAAHDLDRPHASTLTIADKASDLIRGRKPPEAVVGSIAGQGADSYQRL
jgi:hypothetical protein